MAPSKTAAQRTGSQRVTKTTQQSQPKAAAKVAAAAACARTKGKGKSKGSTSTQDEPKPKPSSIDEQLAAKHPRRHQTTVEEIEDDDARPAPKAKGPNTIVISDNEWGGASDDDDTETELGELQLVSTALQSIHVHVHAARLWK